ncbi:transcriptional regulator, partial [Staphylococcus aureus]|nr:transcriptional regulator [Staphylococcus aureus]
ASQLNALIAILRDLGFDPSYPNQSGNIGLNACPFTTVGVSAPSSVICALHAGYLDELSGGIVHKLLPYSRPSQCEIEL